MKLMVDKISKLRKTYNWVMTADILSFLTRSTLNWRSLT